MGDVRASFRVAVRLGVGETEVSFANVDDTLVVVLDGERSVFPFPDAPSQPPCPEDGISAAERGNFISIAATNTKALLTDLRIDRDLHYFGRTGRGGTGWSGIWKIPEDCYLAFGDNTLSSSDSREWRVTRVVLEDGTVIAWGPGQTREEVSGVVTIEADVDGRERSYRIDDVAEEADSVPWPLVGRADFIGRAMAILFSEDLQTGEPRWERWGNAIR